MPDIRRHYITTAEDMTDLPHPSTKRNIMTKEDIEKAEGMFAAIFLYLLLLPFVLAAVGR